MSIPYIEMAWRRLADGHRPIVTSALISIAAQKRSGCFRAVFIALGRGDNDVFDLVAVLDEDQVHRFPEGSQELVSPLAHVSQMKRPYRAGPLKMAAEPATLSLHPSVAEAYRRMAKHSLTGGP